jgi:hypothetical protein
LTLLLISVLVLLIPIPLIVLDFHALAGWLERRNLVEYLEGEVERLASELKRLNDEGQFFDRLLLEGGGASSPATEG